MPKHRVDVVTAGVGGSKMPSKNLFGPNPFLNGIKITFGGSGKGTKGNQANGTASKKAARKWAVAPAWAHGASSGSAGKTKKDNGPFAAGGDFIVGIGGSKIPKTGLFGPNPFLGGGPKISFGGK